MPSNYDVVIVGAGITGCVTAAELADRGQSVLVLEKDDIAFEASGRNMGAIGVLGKYASAIAGASVAKWDEAIDSLPQSFEFKKMGRLCPAETPEQMAILQEMQDTARESGLTIDMLTPDQIRERFPELKGTFHGAAYSAADALVNSVEATQAYAALARKRGAEIRIGDLVTKLVASEGILTGVALSTGEVITAAKVLLAAGVWTARLLQRANIHIPMQYVSIYHGETQPLEPAFDYFLRGSDYGARQMSNGVIRVTGGFEQLGAGHYLSLHDFRDLRIWAPRLVDRRKEVQFRLDLRIIKSEFQAAFGGAPAPRGFDPAIPQRFPRQKLAALQRVVKGVEHAEVQRTIAGMVDMTADALPILGPVDPIRGLYVAAGFNGQGFGLGPVVGEMMAQNILGLPTSLPIEPYRWSRFRVAKQIPMPHRLV